MSLNKDQENKIREEFDKKFPLPKILALSGGKGVERDLMIKFFLTKMKEQIEIAVREERERIKHELSNTSLRLDTNTGRFRFVQEFLSTSPKE